MNRSIQPPTWFWIVAVVSLIWNLMGVMAFYMDITISPETMASLPDIEQEFRSGFPMWTKIVYAIAVFGGMLGCIGLLLRKKWSKHLFGLSFIGILLQFGFAIGRMAKFNILTADKVIMPALVIIIGALLLIHARKSEGRSWIT